MSMAPDQPKHKLIDRLLLADARFVYHHPKSVIAAGLVLVLFSGWFAFGNLGFKTSGGDLISADDEMRALAREYRESFRDEEDFVLLVRSGKAEETAAASDWLTERILENPLLAAPDGSNLFTGLDQNGLREKALYYFEETDLLRLNALISQLRSRDHFELGIWLEEAAEALDPMRMRAGETAPDPSGLGPEALAQLLDLMQQAAEGEAVTVDAGLLLGQAAAREPNAGALSFDEGRLQLLLLTPHGPEGERPRKRDQVEELRQILDQARERFPSADLYLTGEPVLDSDERATYERDASLALAITLAVVFLIFAYAYRDWVRPVLKISVLIAAVIGALGFTAATVGHLNVLSVAFIVMILGLGDDFAIYVITRYEEERAKGHEPLLALENCLLQSGHAVIMASMTISISFATMILTGLPGLMEMGIVAGGGIVICAMLCLTVLPALLLCQRREREGHRHEIRHRFTPVLLRAERYWLRHCRGVVIFTGILILVAALSLVRWPNLSEAWQTFRTSGSIEKALGQALAIQFEYDLLALQNPDLESVRAVRIINEVQPIFMALVVVDTLEEVDQLQSELAEKESVGRTVSVLGGSRPGEQALPPDQAVKEPLIVELTADSRGLRLVEAPVRAERLAETAALLAARSTRAARLAQAMGGSEAAEELRQIGATATELRLLLEGERQIEATRNLKRFQSDLTGFLNETLEFLATQKPEGGVTIDDLPDRLRSRYIGSDGRYLVEIYPALELDNRERLEQFDREVRSVTPLATGTPVMINRFMNMLRLGYSLAALYALIFVTLAIALYFRGWKPTLLCLFPLLTGVILLLAIMNLTGLAFNVANIITLPLIIGIGVDNGILILQRFRHEPSIELFSRNTGRAILMSNCSTVAGFGALAIAQHQGIASLGLIMSLGVGLTMVISLISLPALICWLKQRGTTL